MSQHCEHTNTRAVEWIGAILQCTACLMVKDKQCLHWRKPDDVPCPECLRGKEKDPTGRRASDPGAKLDEGKILAGVLGDFSLALLSVAEVGTFGAKKYSRGGWQEVPDGETRYHDAEWRHLLRRRHEDLDPDSGLLHDAHRAWNVLAALELKLRKNRSL